MPGPCSVPNGDTRLVFGHANEAFVCEKHGENSDACFGKPGCDMISLRTYLAKRNRLVTGKTK